jgi:hypothetical protein
MKGQDNAHVASAWKYPNQTGGDEHVMTMWMLRREPEGFRVYGSVMYVPELAAYDGGQVVFDFEDSEQVAATESRVIALLEKVSNEQNAAAVAELPEQQPPVRQR